MKIVNCPHTLCKLLGMKIRQNNLRENPEYLCVSRLGATLYLDDGLRHSHYSSHSVSGDFAQIESDLSAGIVTSEEAVESFWDELHHSIMEKLL